jgi:hypothetical protein
VIAVAIKSYDEKIRQQKEKVGSRPQRGAFEIEEYPTPGFQRRRSSLRTEKSKQQKRR